MTMYRIYPKTNQLLLTCMVCLGAICCTPAQGQMALQPASSEQDAIGPLPNDGTPATKIDSLTVSSTSSSASAAFARSLFLFLGLMFRRPSKLFRPSRVDTWGGLRQLAQSADQSLSPAFIKSLLRRKTGIIALTLTIIPPLAINTTLGFLLFTSHSVFALGLARIPFFQHHHHPPTTSNLVDHESPQEDEEEEEEEITLETLLTGPHIIPRHPTLLSALAGAGAGLVQGMAFTPVENLVRLLSQSASSITSALGRLLNLPSIKPVGSLIPTPISPIQSLKAFLSSEAWMKSPGWWTGWRWTVARDALSYGVFFAAFDITRRCGLRMKALFGGSANPEWNNFITISRSIDDTPPGKADSPISTPTRARVAQATTIVAGGVTASILAEIAGRPFRTCQKLMTERSNVPSFPSRGNPVFELYKAQGLRPFFRKDGAGQVAVRERGVGRMVKRFGWRLAAVGPWGFGFLVWAWVGGEV